MSIGLAWQAPGPASTDRAAQSPSGDICEDYAIEEIRIRVYDASDNEVATANQTCARHSATITGIPAGAGLWLEVDALVAERPDWHCRSAPFSVVAGENTSVDAIMEYMGGDENPPGVAAMDPPEGTAGVLLNSDVSVSFNEAVVAASVNISTFVLQAGGTAMNGSVRYEPTTLTAVFTPEGDLSPATEYTAVLTTEIEDMTGHRLPAEISWHFSTISAPAATTLAAGQIQAHDVVLNGSVNPNGGGTTYYFEYGFDDGYGMQTAAVDIGGGTEPQAASASISGLAPGTTYHYRLVAANAHGTVPGGDMTVTTAHVVWFSENSAIVKVSSAGEELLNIDQINCSGLRNYRHFDIDPHDGSLWIAESSSGRLIKLDLDGNPIIVVRNQSATGGVAVDSRDGSIWTTRYTPFQGSALVKLTSFGLPIIETQPGLSTSPYDNSFDWDPVDNSLWMADYDSYVYKLFGPNDQLDGYDPNGPSGSNHLRIDGFGGQTNTVSVHPDPAGYIWVSDRSSRVVQFSRSGSENFSITPLGFGQMRTVTADIFDGSVWAGGTTRVAKYSETGEELVNVGIGSSIDCLETDPFDGGVWVGDRSQGLIKLSSTGAEQWRREPAGIEAIALDSRSERGKKIHVSKSGSDSEGDGSAGSPFETIGRGIEVARNGDSVAVASGIYNENIIFKNGVEIQGTGVETTTIEGLGNTHVLDGTGVNRVTLSGFTVTGSGAVSAGIYCAGCKGLVIRQNKIVQNGGGSHGGTGLIITGNSSALIEHNEILDNENAGISVGGESRVVIRNNIIARNDDCGISGGSSGIVHIINNVIDNNGSEISGRSGILISGDFVIMNNIISNNGYDNPNPGLSVGIYVNGSGSHTLGYNNVYNNFQGPYTGISAGEGDINVDPQYAGPAEGNYTLEAGSPSINTGDPELYDEGIDCRHADSRSDMGAYGGPWALW